uniref:AIG1-type G domain-containing protein n=1 Tax=Panagrolaimus sp. ES5 TaxID=591445 RepID=A0AC34EZH5_9BILA
MNEKNEDEIQKLIDKKYCIVLNETTIKYLKEVYSDDNDYCFILSEKDDAKHFQEPMLHYLKDKFYKIGISTYQNEPDISTKLAKEAIIFLECDCHSEKKLIERKCLKSKTPGELQYNKQLFDQESCQDINSDICNDLKSGPKDTIKNVSVPKESSTENLASPESKSIIFVGQTGAGKSTLINSIANYIKYDFDNACQNFMRCCLPLNFQMQTADMKNFTIKAGPENENENFNEGGHSVTQKPQTYTISGNNEIINIIDTPGLGDSRGADQDVINMEYIRTAIIGCEKIDAICFIMPSNTSKLTAHFEVVMRDLLSLFPKTALKNVFFFFTYANSSFFAIGNTAKSLEQFIVKFKETNNAEILFGPENVFCVDSEAFMYFLAIEHQYQYRNRSRESFRDSWEKSKEAINKFFSKLKSVEPIKSTDIKMNYELEKCAVEFSNNLNLSSELKNISNLIAQTFVDNSMSSISFTNRKHFNDAELKESVTAASEFCKKLAKDDILKQKIEQLLQYYYKISFDENDTNFPITPINCKLKTELKEICKSLVKIWKPDETDAIYLNALLCIHCAVYSKEILENLEDSLKILQNHFGTSENREIQQKIEKLLSMFI